MDTIDIDDFAKQIKDDLVNHFTDISVAAAISAWPWLGAGGSWAVAPIKEMIHFIIEHIFTTGGMAAFMINTNIFTTDQASDYVKTIEKRDALPEDVSDAVWDRAEQEANHALGNLINLRK